MPEEPLKPVGKLTPVDPSELKPASPKPVGKLTPVGEVEIPMPKEYGIKDIKSDDQLENTLNDIVKTSRIGISDSEKDMLRDMLKNPNLTPEQAKESIQAIQGWHPKQKGNTFTTPEYYVKKEDNGVLRPIPLSKGERPPKGYQVANVWGQTKKNAEDDSWYTDLTKSLFNALPELSKSVAEVGNLGSLAITGEESPLLNRVINTSESLKMFKDQGENGGRTLYNPSEANKFDELLTKDKFELSPESLWNTINWAVESLPQFIIGAGSASATIQSSKAALNIVRGVKGVSELGKVGQAASVFASSYAMQVGDNMEAAKEAGLEGRDIATVAGMTTFVQAGLDAVTGFDIGAKLFNSSFKNAEKELIKRLVKDVEKDAEGRITTEGFKQLGKQFAGEYGNLAKSFAKEAAKDTGGEMTQEVLQEFTAKAGQQIWDNMSAEDKAKFGTDAFDAKSFASYLSAGINSLGVAPVSVMSAKAKYKEQSADAFKIVESGKDKIDEFTANIYAAERRGDITPEEKERALFKVDSYAKYQEQTKDLPNMSKEDKKEAFELSFNIEGLKSEIPEDMEGLDPIAIAKVKNKEELIKGLQKDLNHILLKQDIQTETIVPDKVKDDVAKEVMPEEPTEGKKKTPSLDELIEKIGGLTPAAPEGGKINIEKNTAEKRMRLFNAPTVEFNQAATERPMEVKAAVQEYLKSQPKGEMDVTIREAQNQRYTFDVGDGKNVRFGQSVKGEKDNYFRHENLPTTRVEVEDRGGDAEAQNEGLKVGYYQEPAVVKRVEFMSKNRDGEPMVKAVLPVYNKESGKFIGFAKEHRVGKSNYSEEDKVHLNKIQNANWLTDDLSEYEYKSGEKKVKKVKEPKPVKVKPEPVKVDKNEVFKREPVKVLDAHYMINARQKQQLIDDGYDNATIQAAIKETNRIMALPAHEAFEELGKKGIFNLGKGEKLDVRPNVGLDKDQYNATVKQLEEGKRTKTVEKLLDFIDNIKKTGNISTIQGTGGSSVKVNMPLVLNILGEKSNSEVGLTEADEAAELEKEVAREQVFAEEGKFQKEAKFKGDITATVEAIKKAFPKVKVVMDSSIKGAAQVQGNTIKINPEYAGLDSPIHEAGHILIDAIGYKDKVIQDGINQLRDTKLWAETKEKYQKNNPGFTDEMLAKEVLAESIGREGAGIFDKVNKQARFMQVLNYLFDKLKQLFGIDKNVAKSLAKQIISGIGTKELVGENETLQQQKEASDEDIRKAKELIDKINRETDLSKLPLEYLSQALRAIDLVGSFKGKGTLEENLKRRLALNLKERGIANSKKQISRADTEHKDINKLNIFMKVLSHFSEAFPEMQEFSKMWEKAFFKKMKSAEAEKNTHNELAKNVINEYNKKLGIVDRVKILGSQVIGFNQNQKYFGFIDNKGKILTIDEARKKRLSDAQIKYLQYVRDLMAKRMDIPEGETTADMEMDVLKLNKTFGEAFLTEGIVSGVASAISDNKLNNVRISFKNPTTGKTTITEFKNIKSALNTYANNGNRFKATLELLDATRRAKAQFNKGYHEDGGKKDWPSTGEGDPILDDNGNLRSKFGDNTSTGNSYSKDFYTAVNKYIDDSAHIEHISPLIPVINSIEFLAENGVMNEDKTITHKKPNLAKYMKSWTNLHIWEKQDKNAPVIDKTLKFLRFMSSARMMMFNATAQALNLAVGTYMNWVENNGKDFLKGYAKLFGNPKYSLDLAKKYRAVTVDMDSNPIRTGYGIFASLGFAGTKWGEIINQASGMLGRISEEDYNSFEYKENKYKVNELVFKPGISKEKQAEIEARILDHINKTTDIHGKYGEKDRRNIMNNELGKAVMQFKVWMPDWWRLRMGDEGRYKIGFNTFIGLVSEKGRKEMADAIRKDGGAIKHFWNDEVFMKNLKGLMFTSMLLVAAHSDDEDEEKSKMAKVLDRLLSDVLFIFDPNNLKFTITRPIASVDVIERFLNVASDMLKMDGEKAAKDAVKLVPGQNVIVPVIEDITDEE